MKTCVAVTSVTLFLVVGWAHGAVAADDVADFYRGKSLSLIIGSGPAGGYDLSGRLIAQHLPRFIPGRPSIVVRNMPGASSVVAALHIFNVAPKDGTVIGLMQPTLPIDKLNDRTLKFEPELFTWIGRVDSLTSVGIVWHTSPVQTVAEAKQKEIILSGITATGTAATVPWAINQLVGTKFKVALGYHSSAQAGLAIERGEVQGTGATSWDYLQTKRDWFEQKKITFLYNVGITRYHEIPDVPTIVELTQDPNDRLVLGMIGSSATIGRSLISTPGAPADRVAALRQAFDTMVKDPEFLADAKQRTLGVDPMPGAEVQRIVADVAGAPEAVVAKMRDVTRPPK